ncbi:uncharacterized protein M6G45_016658 [Spheniscus humboldti]
MRKGIPPHFPSGEPEAKPQILQGLHGKVVNSPCIFSRLRRGLPSSDGRTARGKKAWAFDLENLGFSTLSKRELPWRGAGRSWRLVKERRKTRLENNLEVHTLIHQFQPPVQQEFGSTLIPSLLTCKLTYMLLKYRLRKQVLQLELISLNLKGTADIHCKTSAQGPAEDTDDEFIGPPLLPGFEDSDDDNDNDDTEEEDNSPNQMFTV